MFFLLLYFLLKPAEGNPAYLVFSSIGFVITGLREETDKVGV